MSPSNHDRRLAFALRWIAFSTCSLLVLILGFLVWQALPALQDLGPRLATDSGWFPSDRAADGVFGLWPMVAGSLAVTAGASLLALPTALASAFFCRFYAPPLLARCYRRLIELLVGIPSVVFGFWGLISLAPRIAALEPPGPSLLAGILILTLMILPTMMLLSDAAMADVPAPYLQGAVALGLGRWTILRHVVIPACRPGLATGWILGTARAVGETMAVVMVCGNVIQVPGSLFDPVRTLTANIALEMGYALGDHRSALFASGLVLLLLVMLLVTLSEGLGRWLGAPSKG